MKKSLKYRIDVIRRMMSGGKTVTPSEVREEFQRLKIPINRYSKNDDVAAILRRDIFRRVGPATYALPDRLRDERVCGWESENMNDNSTSSENMNDNSSDPSIPTVPKRRGRPPKDFTPSIPTVPKKRGRPKKEVPVDLNQEPPKLKREILRKALKQVMGNSSLTCKQIVDELRKDPRFTNIKTLGHWVAATLQNSSKYKRDENRRCFLVAEIEAPKRKRGRPRKEPVVSAPVEIPRKRGRPKKAVPSPDTAVPKPEPYVMTVTLDPALLRQLDAAIVDRRDELREKADVTDYVESREAFVKLAIRRAHRNMGSWRK